MGSLENYKLFNKIEKKPKDSGVYGMAKDNLATSPKTILLKQQNPENSLQILGIENWMGIFTFPLFWLKKNGNSKIFKKGKVKKAKFRQSQFFFNESKSSRII